MFTSGGTESNNHAILGVVAAASGKTKHVITSAIEHVAVLDPCRALAKSGVDLTVLPVERDGLVNPEDVRARNSSRDCPDHAHARKQRDWDD